MPDDLNLHFKCPIRSNGHFQGLGLGQPNFNTLNICIWHFVESMATVFCRYRKSRKEEEGDW